MAKYIKPFPNRKPIYPTHKKESRGHSHNFYRRNTWKRFRVAYIEQLKDRQMNEINNLNITDSDKIILLDAIPVCENCWSEFIKGFKPGVKTGHELDHIKPVNPNNPMETKGIYGEPFDDNNIQLLCSVCHSSKSSKDRMFHANIQKDV